MKFNTAGRLETLTSELIQGFAAAIGVPSVKRAMTNVEKAEAILRHLNLLDQHAEMLNRMRAAAEP